MISILGPLMLLFDQSPHKLNTIHLNLDCVDIISDFLYIVILIKEFVIINQSLLLIHTDFSYCL